MPYTVFGAENLNIKFLGTHHSETKNTRLVTFVVDGKIAVDSGALSSELTLPEQKNIIAILLSHAHYDHIKGVPSYVFNNLNKTTKVYATKETLDVMSSHLFDGVIYPNFTEKPDFLDNKPIDLIEIKVNKTFEIDGYKILALPIDHIKGSICFEISSKDDKKIVYTGDTGPGLSDIWSEVSPDLLIIDLTFPDRMYDTAKDSKHLCPKMLKEELISFKKINDYYPKVMLIHLNPKLEDEIRKEVKIVADELGIHIGIATEGDELEIK